MGTLLSHNTSFWDVVAWMAMLALLFMAIWLFIAVFSDIFRSEMSGWAKALWVLVIFVLPLLGILIYLIARPKSSEDEVARARGGRSASGQSGPHMTTDDIARAHEMLKAGEITQAEFDEIKAKTLGTG